MKQKLNIFLGSFFLIAQLLVFSTPVAAQSTPQSATSTQTATATAPSIPAGGGSTQQSIKNYLCAPSEGSVNNGTDFYNCINKLYRFGIAIGLVFAVLFITIAGYMYMGGSEESKKTAKSIIASTFAGILILLLSYVFLQQINPNLVKFKSIQPPAVTDPCSGKSVSQCLAVGAGETAGLDVPLATATASADGIATGTPGGFPNFKQTAAPWGSQAYGNCQPPQSSTVGTSGCGPTSLTNVIAYYQQKGQASGAPVDPGQIAKLAADKGFRACGSGTAYGMFPAVASMYGLSAQNGVSWSQAEAALRAGTPVIAAMGPGDFTSGGHFIVLYGIDANGNVLISDSGPRNIISAPIATVQSQQHFLTIITSR